MQSQLFADDGLSVRRAAIVLRTSLMTLAGILAGWASIAALANIPASERMKI